MAGGIFNINMFGRENQDTPSTVVKHRAFELKVRQILEEEYYPPEYHQYMDREEIMHDDGASDCPDLAIYIDGANECECVVEAKDRAVLKKDDIKTLARYRKRRSAGRAMMYVPARCHIQRGAHEEAASLEIEIFRVSDLD